MARTPSMTTHEAAYALGYPDEAWRVTQENRATARKFATSYGCGSIEAGAASNAELAAIYRGAVAASRDIAEAARAGSANAAIPARPTLASLAAENERLTRENERLTRSLEIIPYLMKQIDQLKAGR